MTAILLLAAAVLAASPVSAAVCEEARWLMGTVVVVRAGAVDAETAEAAVRGGWNALVRVDSLMSTWRDDSDLARVNAAAGGEPVAVDPATAAVIADALAMARASGGAFDPTVLPLMRAWGLRDGEARRPQSADLAAALALTGAHLVRLDEAVATVQLLRRGMALDLGGIAKGHALDAAITALTAAGATQGLVDLGGSLRTFGGGAADSVDIVAPDDPAAIVARMALGGGAVATSGQYERFVEIDGATVGHILDPRSGLPVDRQGSVTVVAPDGSLADALATALFVLGPEAGARLAARWPQAQWAFVVPAGPNGWAVLRSGDPGSSRSP